MKDFFGHQLSVGDVVAFNSYGRRGLQEGKIHKLNGNFDYQNNCVTVIFKKFKSHDFDTFEVVHPGSTVKRHELP